MSAGAQVPRKWRPTLAMIVVAMLGAVLLVPVVILGWFRLRDGAAALGRAELTAIGLTLAVAVLAGLVFVRTITRPINALVQRAEAIGKGGRAAILPPELLGTRELATLSASLLTLAERLVDRTDYVSGFASHVSHEFKSPLTAIRGAAELMRDEEMSAAERRRFLDHIIADADRLAVLLEKLRELAQAELASRGGSCRLGTVLAGEAGVLLSGDLDAVVPLDEAAARAVFGQLIANAREAGAQQVTVSVRQYGTTVEIEVADDGAGISPGNQERIFEPFFTTRREKGGTGMGLQIVRGIVVAHGGTIALLSSTRGARFLLSFSAPI